MEVSGQFHSPAALPSEKELPPPPPGIQWIEGWVDSRAGLDVVAKKEKLSLQRIQSRSSDP
jgi:hypothetical protein